MFQPSDKFYENYRNYRLGIWPDSGKSKPEILFYLSSLGLVAVYTDLTRKVSKHHSVRTLLGHRLLEQYRLRW